MMKQVATLFVVLLFSTQSSLATPIFSTDGSRLTDLLVEGVFYKVAFGNAVPEDVYGEIEFDAAREDEANAVSAAIVEAFNQIGGIAASDVWDVKAASAYYLTLIAPGLKITTMRPLLSEDSRPVELHGSWQIHLRMAECSGPLIHGTYQV